MRIAIVGGGISGLTAGYHLHADHEVTLFEAGSYIGGHTNTIEVEEDGRQLAIDTGFIVFNDRTYPNFIKLLGELEVSSQPTRMSFSVRCEKTGLEYRGADLNGLFAQRTNLLNPRYLHLLWEIARFNRVGNQLLEANNDSAETVGEFFDRVRFSKRFLELYFLPMGSAIWSASFETFEQFPISFICEFYKNHGLLGLSDRPQWRVIRGGSKQYIGPLVKDWRDRIRLNTPVSSMRRNPTRVELCFRNGAKEDKENFDHVIFACHSDQALRILGDQATDSETDVLNAFPYQENEAILHTQSSVLPKNQRAWACWNYHRPLKPNKAATVTYNMNMLQSLDCRKTYCVTLNDEGRIDDNHVIRKIRYAHPTFDSRQKQMQRRHVELINHHGVSYCGAYWGSGFHEDGVKSALAVVKQLKEAPQYA